MKKITKIEGNTANSFIKPKTRVVAYCRVSTGSDEQLVSLQAKKAYIMTRVSAARKRKTALTYLECYQTVKLGELT